MTNSEIIEQLDSIVGTYEILVGNGVNSDILEIDDIEAIREAIKALNAEPKQKTARWLRVDRGGVEYTGECSNCGRGTFWHMAICFNYCPNCGSKMEVEENGR